MNLQLWLVRHGTTEHNTAGRFNGWNDIELSDKGRAQAAAIAEHLKGIDFEGIWCSDLGRCVETAQLAGVEAVSDPRLRELNFGDIEGLTWSDLDEAERERLLTFEGYAAPNGESVDELRTRLDSFVADLVPGRHLVFTHGGPIRLLARAQKGDWGGREAGMVQPGELLILDL